ncbi:MAG: cation-transporting P-type ATPase, partial [Sarcina sp.]
MFNGLNNDQVKEKRQKYGDNIIHEAPPETFWNKFKEAFGDPMIKLLIAIAVILFILAALGYAEFGEIVGIVIAVLLVTFISAKTEIASDNEYRKLKATAEKDKCKVYRNGKAIEILADEVVTGDYIILQSGDKIPADGLLIDGKISVDNSALNGEAEECKKFTMENYDESEADKEFKITGEVFVDKHSLFRGAVVVNGSGIMAVTRVGMNTVMGSMAKDMADDNVESPLKIKLTDLANKISKFGYIGAVVIGVAFMAHKVLMAGGIDAYLAVGDKILILRDVLDALMLAVVIVVMAVPEGLPLMIAIVLMKNTAKMLKRNVLVRKPIGIETAGSLNILFSDKTGTITKGKLEVVEFFDAEIKDAYKSSENTKEIMSLCIAKNTDAMFDGNGNVIGGNATDKALMNFLGKEQVEKYTNIKVDKIQQFNSTNKYSASEMHGKTVYKGAPERLLGRATKYVNENGDVLDIDKDKINAKIDALAEKAMRVLAFAYCDEELVENELPENLVIVGFVG